MSDLPAQATPSTARLSSASLIVALRPLYPLPRKNQPVSSRPTVASLHAFVGQIPQAQHALPPPTEDDQSADDPTDGLKEVPQKRFAKDLGLVALWAAEVLDDLVRDESKKLAKDAPPVLPVTAPPLILTLLSHTITHVLQPLFARAFPPPPAPTPPPTPSSFASSSRFTEILPEVTPTASQVAARERAKEELELALARVLTLAVIRPVTDVGRLVRDGGVVRSVLKMAVAVGWDEPKRDDLQRLVHRVLDSFRPTQTLALLSPLLPATTFPAHVRRAAGSLMTRALLRPGGVEGVLQGVFGGTGGDQDSGKEESDTGQKSLSVAKVLGTVPGGMEPSDYYGLLVPRLVPLLTSPSTPSTYLRPLSLTIVSLLTSPNPATASVAQRLILPHLHDALLSPHSYQTDSLQSPSAAFLTINLLLPLILLTPPSATAHALLLEPILPQLFGLHWHLQQSRTADPILRREVEGCLRSWGRVGEAADVRSGLEAVLRAGRGWQATGGAVLPGDSEGAEADEDGDGEENEWFWQGGGEDIKIVWGRPPPASLSSDPSPSTSSADLEAQTLEMLSLHPPPTLYLGYLKSIDRPSVAGDLFVSLLHELDSPVPIDDGLTSTEGEAQEDPRRRVLVMQIVLKMVDQMGDKLVRGEEGRILAFVRHVLASSEPKEKERDLKGKGRADGESSGGFGLQNLKIVEDEDQDVEEDDSDGLDSDDEVELPVDEEEEDVAGMFGANGAEEGEEEGEKLEGGKLGLVGTAIGLLVAVLQANDSLSPATSPILLLVQSSLARHLNSSTPSIRHLTREARLLISVRSATSSSTPNATSSDPTSAATESILASYREALKLVQDPLVPVRAHGLITLRQLVLPPAQQQRERPSSTSSVISEGKSLLPPALVPAILDVFLQSIQDPDSYVYLNAVKGLSALVDGWGKEVLGRMMGVYARGIGNKGWEGGGEMERTELDARLRVGEALCGVVERSEGALGIYGPTLIPSLLLTFRAPNLPTALRSSALTILTLIGTTNALTLAPYATDLVRACTDLLQVESVAMVAPAPKIKIESVSAADAGPVDEPDEATEEDDPSLVPEELNPLLSPILSNAKHPILRRAALHFLSAVLRSDDLAGDVDDWERVRIVVGYVGRTDVDGLVRGLCGDVGRDLATVMGSVRGDIERGESGGVRGLVGGMVSGKREFLA